jgi:hypothetical protein
VLDIILTFLTGVVELIIRFSLRIFGFFESEEEQKESKRLSVLLLVLLVILVSYLIYTYWILND